MKIFGYMIFKIVAILLVAVGAIFLFGTLINYSKTSDLQAMSIWLFISIALLALGYGISKFANSLREKNEQIIFSKENAYEKNFPKEWADIFLLIDKAGGVKMPFLKKLTNKEQSKIRINWTAFFLGPFYYLALGMWRPMLTYLFCMVLFFMLLDYVAFTYFGKNNLIVSGVAAGAIWGILANVNYYKMKVIGEKNWY